MLVPKKKLRSAAVCAGLILGLYYYIHTMIPKGVPAAHLENSANNQSIQDTQIIQDNEIIQDNQNNPQNQVNQESHESVDKHHYEVPSASAFVDTNMYKDIFEDKDKDMLAIYEAMDREAYKNSYKHTHKDKNKDDNKGPYFETIHKPVSESVPENVPEYSKIAPEDTIVGTPVSTEDTDNIDDINDTKKEVLDSTRTAVENFLDDMDRGHATIEHEVLGLGHKQGKDSALTHTDVTEAQALWQQLNHMYKNIKGAAGDLQGFLSRFYGSDAASKQAAGLVAAAEAADTAAKDRLSGKHTNAKHGKVEKRKEFREKNEQAQDPMPWLKDTTIFGNHLYK